MSSGVTNPSDTKKPASSAGPTSAKPSSKGKSKAPAKDAEEEEDEDEEEEMGSEEEEEDEEEEESFEEIDPSAIVGRRTRGIRVDYSSAEALKKAGLQGNEHDEDEEDQDVEMKD